MGSGIESGLGRREIEALIAKRMVPDDKLLGVCVSEGLDEQAASRGFVRYRSFVPLYPGTVRFLAECISRGEDSSKRVMLMLSGLTKAGYDPEAAKRGELVDLCKESPEKVNKV